MTATALSSSRSAPRRDFVETVIVWDDPDQEPGASGSVEFRLTYSGKLYASANKNPNESARRFWDRDSLMLPATPSLPSGPVTINAGPTRPREAIAERFSLGGFRFVPLVTADLALICGIDILLLRLVGKRITWNQLTGKHPEPQTCVN